MNFKDESSLKTAFLNAMKHAERNGFSSENARSYALKMFPTIRNSIKEITIYKNIKSKYFELKFGSGKVPDSSAIIMLGNIWFANAFRPFGEGDWAINRAKGALDMNFPSCERFFKTLEELLQYLDEWYESKSQLNESSTDVFDYESWWLDPNGNFYGVGFETHRPWAVNYLYKKYGIVNKEKGATDAEYETVYNQMYKLGWIRVAIGEDSFNRETIEYSYNHSILSSPNSIQIRSIKDMARMKGINSMRDTAKRELKNVNEVKFDDINSRLDWPGNSFDKKIKQHKLDMLTLSNLKAMMEKEKRFYNYAKKNEDVPSMTHSLYMYKIYRDEIQSRLDQINEPIAESDIELGQEHEKDSTGTNKIKLPTFHTTIDNDGHYGHPKLMSIKTDEDALECLWGKVKGRAYKMLSNTNKYSEEDSKKYSKMMADKMFNLKRDSRGNVFNHKGEKIRWTGLYEIKRMNEGCGGAVGWGQHPEKDRLHIPGERWRIKWGGKTPPLKEDNHYNAASDFYERRDKQLCEIASFLKQNPKSKRIPWQTIPASLLIKTWFKFGKYSKIDVNDIDKIADRILTNIARLEVANAFQGHANYDPREEILDNCGIEFTDKEWNDNVWRFCDKRGTDYISDYGIDPLTKIYVLIFNAETPEEKIYACDKALNVVHQRNDLASMFVEGGTSTLTKVANQGGYTKGYNYGDVNKEFLKLQEGIGKDGNLYLGFMSKRNFQIAAKDISQFPEYTHSDFMRTLSPEWKSLHNEDIIKWRYRRDLNTIYFWKEHTPNQDQKHELDYWLGKYMGVRNPHHKIIEDKYSGEYDDSHYSYYSADENKIREIAKDLMKDYFEKDKIYINNLTNNQ